MKDSTARRVAAAGSMGTLYLIFFMVASPLGRALLLIPPMMGAGTGLMVVVRHRFHPERQ